MSMSSSRSRRLGLLLILSLVAAFNVPALAQAPKKAAEPPAVRQEFDAFLARFRAALKADDATAIAGLTQLPFMNDPAVGNAAEFRSRIYAPRFKAKTRACLQRGKPEFSTDGAGNMTYAHFCGASIFTFTRTPAGFLLTDIDEND